MLLNVHLLNEKYTFSLNSISALYPVFSQFIVTTPPNSIVSVPIKIPAKNNYRVGSQVKKLHNVTTQLALWLVMQFGNRTMWKKVTENNTFLYILFIEQNNISFC